MRNITALLLLFGLGSCSIVEEDSSRALHPEEYKGIRSVYIQNYSKGNGYKTFQIDSAEVPEWCNIEDNHKDAVKNFNINFTSDTKQQTPTHVICYSGNKPEINNEELSTESDSNNNVKPSTPFIKEEFNPYLKLYLIGFVLSGKSQNIFPIFFNLYREFCVSRNTECCMTTVEGDLLFTVLVDNPYNFLQIEKVIKNVKTFLANSELASSDISAAFNLFNSTFVDQCSFSTWYYQSAYLGIKRPEEFLSLSKWNQYLKTAKDEKIKIKGIGVKIIDSKRLVGDELSSLKNFLDK